MTFEPRIPLLAAVAAGVLVAFGACAATSKSSTSRLMEGEEKAPRKPDILYLHDGSEIEGQIIRMDDRVIQVRHEDGSTEYIPPGAVLRARLSPTTEKELNARPMRPVPVARKTALSSWYPRAYSDEPVNHVEITWWDKHDFSGKGSCAGQLAESYKKFPEMQLYLPPGGWLILRDRRQVGYHAHTFPEGFHKPVEKRVLRIPVPKDEGSIPSAVAFVSPSQETEAKDGSKRKGVAISAVIYAETMPISHQEAALTRQPFGGGGPQTTQWGKLWAFSLTRNHATWFIYLADESGTHSRFLKTAYAAYGNTVLEANVAIDCLDPAGKAVGRVLVVPFPDDSVTTESVVTIYSGKYDNPTPIVNVPVPPRERIITPGQPSDTKADIRIHHYGVSKEVPQSIILAYGTGRATSEDVKKIERELTPDTADEHLLLDMSDKEETEFPALAWLYQRRTMAWSTGGGRLVVGPDLRVPPPDPQKLTRFTWAPPISHITPVLFLGPNPPTPHAFQGPSPGTQFAGGMANGLAQDALAREAAGNLGNFTGNINPNLSGGDGGYYSNTSNIYVSIPPAGPGGLSTGGMTGGYTPPPAGMYGSGMNPNAFRNINPNAPLAGGIVGTTDVPGNFYNRGGQQTWNNQAMTDAYYSGGGSGNASLSGTNIKDPLTGMQIPVTFSRRNRP